MHITEWCGFSKIVGLVRAGLPLSAIVNRHGHAVHYEAQLFTRTQSFAKLYLIQALVTSWKCGNFAELERIVSDGKRNELQWMNSCISKARLRAKLERHIPLTISSRAATSGV